MCCYGARKGVGSGERACPLPVYRIKVILSPPNTPFLLPVPIIGHTFIITNYYISKLCLIFITNILFGQFCVGLVLKACSVCKERRSVIGRLKRMCQNPTPHQTPGAIYYIYSGRLKSWCFVVCCFSLVSGHVFMV